MDSLEIQALERQREATKRLMAQREAIRRLVQNKDYRSVIVEAFSKEECARYVQESADPLLTAVQRADALALAQASGHLRRWLAIQIQLADSAEDQLVGLDAQIEEARREEDGVEE